tara:strand:- start:12395 stop:12997 length:603 start_codon:yes stop_codon:yes gene_type:complete
MINFSYIVITVILMSSVSCSVYNDVQITKDKTVNFDQYESYAWLPDQESKKQSDFNNDFIRQKTRNYFGHCMAQRQLTPDTINPDLLLQVEWLSHAREVEIPAVQDLPNYYDPGYYDAPTIYLYGSNIRGNPVWNNKYSEKEKVSYAHGGARLTVIDRKENKVVWKGTAQGDLYDQKVMYEDLHPVIHKMMKKFPIEIPD